MLLTMIGGLKEEHGLNEAAAIKGVGLALNGIVC